MILVIIIGLRCEHPENTRLLDSEIEARQLLQVKDMKPGSVIIDLAAMGAPSKSETSAVW